MSNNPKRIFEFSVKLLNSSAKLLLLRRDKMEFHSKAYKRFEKTFKEVDEFRHEWKGKQNIL